MSYEQAMKHYRNHRKDRFVQQCSGYGGNGKCHPITEEKAKELEKESWQRLIEVAKGYSFPVHIRCFGHIWLINDKPDLFSIEVSSYKELLEIGHLCL